MPYAKDIANPITTHKKGPGNVHGVVTTECKVAASQPNRVIDAGGGSLKADDRTSAKANAAFAAARPRQSLDQVTNVK